MSDHIIPGGRYYFGGLVYEKLDDTDLWSYHPDGAFHVDGIEYDPQMPGVHISRSMCELQSSELWRGNPHLVSRPPTEAELDEWVRTGHFPQ